jgi:DNA-binding PadR family transcriptional regulator
MRSPQLTRAPVRAPLPLKDLLAAVERRRGTRLELVCWRLDVDEARAAPAWDLALREGLIERRGEDPLTGRAMFALTERGDEARRRLGKRRRRA